MEFTQNNFTTPLYVAILALIYMFLSSVVVYYRRKFSRGIGDGGNKTLHRAIRVHGNFIEYVPITLLLIFFVELSQVSPIYIHTMGLGLVVSRLLHAFGLLRYAGASPGRFIGTLFNFILIVFASCYLLITF